MLQMPVTHFTKAIAQPRGGYIPTSTLDVGRMVDRDWHTPHEREHENVPPQIVGLVVDYLTRLELSGSVADAFNITLKSERMFAEIAFSYDLNHTYFDDIEPGLSDTSIFAACMVAPSDSYYRSGLWIAYPDRTKPNTETIENVRAMVQLSLEYLNTFDNLGHGLVFAPPKLNHDTRREMGPMAFPAVIAKGDCDFHTDTTILDMKVLSKKNLTKNDKLQLFIYCVNFNRDTAIAFNPRLNLTYTLNVNDHERLKYMVQLLLKDPMPMPELMTVGDFESLVDNTGRVSIDAFIDKLGFNLAQLR